MTLANSLERALRNRGNPSPLEYHEQGDLARLNALRISTQEIACYNGDVHDSHLAF